MRIFGLDIRRTKDVLAPVDSSRGWLSLVREQYSGAWQNGDPLTVDTQLSHYAVYACVSRISEDMGKLRPRLMERDEDGIWSETTSSAFSPVLRKPNRYQNHIQFKELWGISKLTRGNTYALKQRDNRGVVVALYLLDPCRVTPLVATDGSVYYALKVDNLSGVSEEVTVPASEIIHDRINCLFHPLVGISPLYACGLAAAQGLSIQTMSKTFFSNGARPSGVLTAPGQISDDVANRLKTSWEEKFTGSNAGRVAVLGDGLHYEPMVMTATDAQLIDQLKVTAEMICTAFKVPPFKIGLGQMPTYQNGQTLNTIYYTDCLQSHVEQFELCMDDGLGIGEAMPIQGRVLGVDLDESGLLRMDSQTKIQTLAEGIKGSVYKVNEARGQMDLPPVPGGDTIWMQQQNYSLEALQKRDASADPFGTAKPEPPAAPPPDNSAQKFAEILTKKFAEAA